MPKLSVLIPSRNEQFLAKTVDTVFECASGDVEVIVALEAYWPHEVGHDSPKENPNLITIHNAEPLGMRGAISACAAVASGEYLCKMDAHVLVQPGFDAVLKADCEDNMILIPRRGRLEPFSWTEQDVGKPDIDYEFLHWPFSKPDEVGLHGRIWEQRAKERIDIPRDENLSFQGSMWAMKKTHWERIGGMPELGYGKFIAEAQQIGLTTQLGGGLVVTTKRTKYLHFHKSKANGRGYFLSKKELIAGQNFCVDFWMNNRWNGRKFDLEELINNFWPIPSWPEAWQDEVRNWKMDGDGLMKRVAAV